MILNVKELVDETVAKLERFTTRDEEFEARFGRWKRPDFMPKYKLEAFSGLIRYSCIDKEIIDAAPFIKQLRVEDRFLAAEIARFEFETIKDEPATDKTLNTFRLSFLRRLSALGF